MSIEEAWRPLGVDDEDQIAKYDALHDGLPEWMAAPFWAWVREAITENRRYSDGSGRIPHLREGVTEEMAQTLRISLPNLRVAYTHGESGQKQLVSALKVLREHPEPLQIADYILAFFPASNPDVLDALLERSKSAWRVGTRAGRPGLVRRVPLGVQVGADSVMSRAGRAGVRLASGWEVLYSPNPNASEAYRFAILAVEDASIPVVSPKNKSATLGTVLKQMEDQGDWTLPMSREHANAPTREVIVAMMRALWHGQHDRHGGQPSAPGDVSYDEAVVAIGIATSVVHWFSAGLINRAGT